MASSSWTKTSIMCLFVISCAIIRPVEASWAHILSFSMGPGMPRAMTMSQPCSSMSFLHATGRSLKPGTVYLTMVNPVPVL